MKPGRSLIVASRAALPGALLPLAHSRAARIAKAPGREVLALVLLASMLGFASLLTLAPAAHAVYGPGAGGTGAEIVSVDNASDEQGNEPTVDAAISANGRYVVFQTHATNFFENDGVPGGDAEPPGALREGGIFRYDRLTGELALVADGSEVRAEGPEAGTLIFRGAQNPSISSDGRFIVFSTAQQLVPRDKNENIDVYVRDMNVPLTPDLEDSGAYTLVSAQNGSEEPAIYAPHTPPLSGDEPGSEVWPNTSVSADGRYVVFSTTEQESDLPDGHAVDVPPEQLFVRDLREKTTTLLSREITGDEPAGGSIGPATISADGSTVSWVATNAPAQTRFLPGEAPNSSEPYYLWRRWQEPGTPTRRITGIADPDDFECHEGEGVTENSLATGPCYGPLSEPESSLASIALAAPGLSANGYTVAFLAGAALRPNITKARGLDIFLTSMLPGVTRKAGTRELTLSVSSGNPGSTPSIESIALSPDGSTIAFTTSRDSFVLPEPHPVGTFREIATVSDLYVIHLAEDTLERAVVNYEGTDPSGSVSGNPTLTQDGATLAFTSSSSDLTFGDANQVSDAFTATLLEPAGSAQPSPEVNAVQGGFSLSATSIPELGVSVKRGRAGEAILLVETPESGRLTAQAKGALPKAKTKKRKTKKASVVLLGQASASASSEGTTTLVLHVASRYEKDLKRAGKLKASVTIDFKPSPAGEALIDEAALTFYSTATSKPSKTPKPKPKA